MTVTNQRPLCRTPNLCVIACPYNRVLTELGERPCELPLSLPDDDDSAIEVIFQDSPIDEESS